MKARLLDCMLKLPISDNTTIQSDRIELQAAVSKGSVNSNMTTNDGGLTWVEGETDVEILGLVDSSTADDAVVFNASLAFLLGIEVKVTWCE